MSKSNEEAKAEGYFAGVIMAYEDCAVLADTVANGVGNSFQEGNMSGIDPHMLKVCRDSVKATLVLLAKTFREKKALAYSMVREARL